MNMERDILSSVQVVLLTGASSGIGRAAAKYFYLSGCKVILASRKVDELEKVKSELLELKVKAILSSFIFDIRVVIILSGTFSPHTCCPEIGPQ